MPEINLQRIFPHSFRRSQPLVRHQADKRHTDHHGDSITQQTMLPSASRNPDQRIGVSSCKHPDDGKNIIDPVKTHKKTDEDHEYRGSPHPLLSGKGKNRFGIQQIPGIIKRKEHKNS